MAESRNEIIQLWVSHEKYLKGEVHMQPNSHPEGICKRTKSCSNPEARMYHTTVKSDERGRISEFINNRARYVKV